MAVRRSPGPAVGRIQALVAGLDGYVGKTGYFETAKYEDGTPVAYVAAINEFGHPEGGIPARPTMRPTAAAEAGAWRDLIGQGAKAVLDGRMTAPQVLESVALKAAGDVGKSIAALTSPPNKPETIRRKKGATKPLIETGLMFQSVTGVVERKG